MLLLHAPGTKQSFSGGILRTTTWGRRLALLTLLMLLVAGLSFADGKKHKLSKDLEAFKGGHNGATVDVIIPFNQTPATCSWLLYEGASSRNPKTVPVDKTRLYAGTTHRSYLRYRRAR